MSAADRDESVVLADMASVEQAKARFAVRLEDTTRTGGRAVQLKRWSRTSRSARLTVGIQPESALTKSIARLFAWGSRSSISLSHDRPPSSSSRATPSTTCCCRRCNAGKDPPRRVREANPRSATAEASGTRKGAAGSAQAQKRRRRRSSSSSLRNGKSSIGSSGRWPVASSPAVAKAAV